MDFAFLGTLFTDPHSSLLTIALAMSVGLATGAVAVALTAVYGRHR